MFLLQTNLYIVRFKTDIPGQPARQSWDWQHNIINISPATTYQVCCVSPSRYQAAGREDFLCFKSRQSRRVARLSVSAIIAILVEYCRWILCDILYTCIAIPPALQSTLVSLSLLHPAKSSQLCFLRLKQFYKSQPEQLCREELS